MACTTWWSSAGRWERAPRTDAHTPELSGNGGPVMVSPDGDALARHGPNARGRRHPRWRSCIVDLEGDAAAGARAGRCDAGAASVAAGGERGEPGRPTRRRVSPRSSPRLEAPAAGLAVRPGRIAARAVSVSGAYRPIRSRDLAVRAEAVLEQACPCPTSAGPRPPGRPSRVSTRPDLPPWMIEALADPDGERDLQDQPVRIEHGPDRLRRDQPAPAAARRRDPWVRPARRCGAESSQRRLAPARPPVGHASRIEPEPE